MISLNPTKHPLTGRMTFTDYLLTLPPAHFKPGHSLPALSNFGWDWHFEASANKVLADRFGYCLRIPYNLPTGRNTSRALEIYNIYDTAPSRYKVGILIQGAAPLNSSVPYMKADGTNLGSYSPWYDQAATDAMIAVNQPDLEWVATRFNIGTVQNPGEYGLGVPANAVPLMVQDYRYANRFLMEYNEDAAAFVNRRKAEQELQLAAMVRQTCPGREAYVNYVISGSADIYTYPGAEGYAYDFSVNKGTTDYPCGSLYFSEFNEGFTTDATGANYWGGRDLWNQCVNQYTQQVASGHYNSLNYVNGGWHVPATARFFSDISIYRGWLKSLYMLGNLATITGFFEQYTEQNLPFDPALGVPHWMTDLVSAGYVHATFSWLEEYLRKGVLMEGTGRFKWNPAFPSYEFGSYQDSNGTSVPSPAKILVRALPGQDKWLISAWSPDGISREVTIFVPLLGKVRLQAVDTCNLYLCEHRGASPKLVTYQPNTGLEHGYIYGNTLEPAKTNVRVNSNNW